MTKSTDVASSLSATSWQKFLFFFAVFCIFWVFFSCFFCFCFCFQQILNTQHVPQSHSLHVAYLKGPEIYVRNFEANPEAHMRHAVAASPCLPAPHMWAVQAVDHGTECQLWDSKNSDNEATVWQVKLFCFFFFCLWLAGKTSSQEATSPRTVVPNARLHATLHSSADQENVFCSCVCVCVCVSGQIPCS